MAKGVKDATPEAQEAWKNTIKEERKHIKAIIRAGNGISQAAFNAKLATVTLTSEASTRNRSSCKTTGHYLDLPALAKKYEGKPEQLKHVRGRTDTGYCATRGVTLYKLPEYHSDDEDEMTMKDS